MEEQISERQGAILALIIHEYVASAQPIGSERLVGEFNLGVSSATVRNDMSSLTDAGMLRQPHTSAGRIPTEEGYRYFVRRLMGEADLPMDEKRRISHQFHQARSDIEEWLQLAAAILAKKSKVASLVTSPHSNRSVFKHLELIATQGQQVLLVLVLQGGEIRQQVLSLAEAVDQPHLTEIAAGVTRACSGLGGEAVVEQGAQFAGLAQDVIKLVSEVMLRSDAASAGEIYRDGLANVVLQPEFADSDSLRQALRLLDERSFLEEVLAKALSPGVGGVQVVIGGEGAWEDLRDLSMVMARYGAPGHATGALAVLGPTRMAYGPTISTVRYVAGLMSDIVLETFAD
jgi:heat-inducible transcriptional repressor